jgi:4-aminobutyrate aminotransferase-like enzyme
VALFGPGSEVRSALAGVVVAARPELVLEHTDSPGPLWSVWSGVTPSVEVGAAVSAGSVIGRGGEGPVHWSLALRRREREASPPQFVAPDDDVWTALSPDPTPLLTTPVPARPPLRATATAVVEAREERVARSQRSYYRRPPLLVRARGTWFTDDLGRQYLDAMNNVAHVGHAHPRVLEAGIRQMRRLNTNSRFVYEALAECADRLAGLLPPGLDVLFFTCTGSESNDLALRIARTCTGRDDVAVLGAAYHGNTTAVSAISPDRFDGPGGAGRPATTHVLPQPDRYRGAYGYDHPDPGAAYAADALAVIDRMVADHRPPAAVFAEPLQGTAGQVVLPDGYLARVFDGVRAAGGLCVVDEVQDGLGRLGTHFWGFQDHGVVPDVVTMGKPLGNGHPISAVATTRAIADAFDNGMRYFNTFGGNPVSCAVALAVLDTVVDDGLQHRAATLGRRLMTGLEGLRDRHELVGDVRGQGLYAGVELVRDRATKEPAGVEALGISERMMELGVLTYPNGRFGNILKLKPPLVASEDDIELLVGVIDQVLTDGW